VTEPEEADWEKARHLAAVSSWAARDVEAIATIIATAKAEERATVVRFMREDRWAYAWACAEDGVMELAQRIERGEHRREEEK
jgi:hypothetical protein